MDNTLSLKCKDILLSDAAQEVCTLALAYREETENLRRLAPPIVKQLKKSKLCRIGLPRFLGGWEDNPVELIKTYELLSSAEASVAWSVWNNHLACTFGRYLDEISMIEIFNDPSNIYSNSTRPEGIAEIVPNGYIVSGRWTLVSGCELSDWFVLRCLVTSEDLPKTLGPGAKLKLFFIPKKEVKVIDTWKVGGLRGTGSHDVEVSKAFVSEKYAVDFNSPVHIDNAYNRLPIGCMNAAGCAAIALGLLKSAIDDLMKICQERISSGKNPDLRDRLTVQAAVSKSKTILNASRTQLHNSVSKLWKESLLEKPFSDKQLADVWSASYHAATTARAMVSEIYAVAGTASLYTTSKIERIHRDIHAVLQHGIIQPHWMNQAGMAYLGLKPTGAMFRI